MRTVLRTLRLFAAVAAIGVGSVAGATEVKGAGSTFVFPILSKWAAEYARAGGDTVVYQPIGSGAGILQIKAGTVDFGASDMPLPPAELAKAGLVQFPLVIGGVVPVVNITGVVPGQLRFSGPILADIYLGKIKVWNDPAIVRLNPHVRLPATSIKVVHRSDGSGTTFNWVHYLSQISPEWRAKVGEGTSVVWPVGVGGKGNDGVAAYVKQFPNSIGYVEYAYVVQRKLTFGSVQNAAGQFVAPDGRSVRLAAATADWVQARDFFLTLTNPPGPNVYPIAATTFVLMYKEPKDEAGSAAALRFFRWALAKGQPQATALDYVPLPAGLVEAINKYLTENVR